MKAWGAEMQLQSVGIIGAGAWGTALATVARRAGRDVLVWAHEPETIAAINDTHRNETFLPGVALDPAIEATGRFNEVATCDMLLMVRRRSICAPSRARSSLMCVTASRSLFAPRGS